MRPVRLALHHSSVPAGAGGDAVHAGRAHADEGGIDAVDGGLVEDLEAVGGSGDYRDPRSPSRAGGGYTGGDDGAAGVAVTG
ncbi:hypothetical protein AB0L14_37990 [Streptomyces sp. NPDC052727]|uniref:hypothetical protein n=1 Tax=Streptomyces sp. NPDC052727 TaxID=3154854 RepID=UPI0034193012